MMYLFFIVLWVLWFYNDDEFKMLLCAFQEKDYQFMCERVFINKKIQTKQSERLVTSLCCSLTLLIADVTTSIMSVVVFVIVYKLQYVLLKNKYKVLLKEAILEFPFLLDKLASLVQVNTIAVALLKSIKEAPKLFEKDLNILVKAIHNEGDSLLPYLQFAKKYPQVEDIESIMRTLYSLSTVGNNKETIILNFCMMSNAKLLKRQAMEDENLIDAFNLYSYALYTAMGLLLLGLFSTMNFFAM